MYHKNFHSTRSVAVLAITFSALPAIAATERQLDSHEHGHAQINMAISGNEVLAELISPAANVVGFEHMPASDEDMHAVEEAVKLLSQGEQMLAFDAAAGCMMTTAEVESELMVDAPVDHDDDHHDGEKHDEHKHDDDHHDGEKHDEHKHDDEHHDGDGHDDHDHDDVHSEFHVTWSFTCEKPDALASVQVNLFEAFSGFDEIDVSVAGESQQSSFELSADQPAIEL